MDLGGSLGVGISPAASQLSLRAKLLGLVQGRHQAVPFQPGAATEHLQPQPAQLSQTSALSFPAAAAAALEGLFKGCSQLVSFLD